jgi:hypothetical protein
MAGGTGSLRTLRNQSGVNGSRTLGSILASDAGAGAGSVRRVYGYYVHHGMPPSSFYKDTFNLDYGAYRARTDWFLKTF